MTIDIERETPRALPPNLAPDLNAQLAAVEAAMRTTAVAPIRFVRWPERRIDNLSSLLDALSARIGVEDRPRADGEQGVRVGEVLAVVGRRAYGPLLLVIGLLSVSPVSLIPGATWAFASATLLVAGQMAIGLRRPWLPKRVVDMRIPGKLMRKSVETARPWARFVDRFLQPRLAFLTQTPFANAVALLCAIAAIVTFPLGFIPIAPLAPSVAIVLFGLGITARDGLTLGLATFMVAGAVYLTMQVVS
jgi:hypothetical protein